MTEATGGTAEAKSDAGGRPPHVAMLATPGMGHLIPLAELAKRLAARHGVTATLITFASTASATQRAFLASLPPAIASLSLPPVDLSDLPADAAIETLMSEECVRVVPALTAILSDLRHTTNLVAFVADLFGADSFDAAAAAGVTRRYLFFPTNLHVLTLILSLPELDVSMPGEFRDLADPVRLPGCVPIPGPDILSPLQDKSNPCYRWMVHHGTRYRDAHAILVNSFDAVEPDAARTLRAPQPGRPPVHNIGPLIKTDDDADADASTRAPCLEWTGPAAGEVGHLRLLRLRRLASGGADARAGAGAGAERAAVPVGGAEPERRGRRERQLLRRREQEGPAALPPGGVRFFFFEGIPEGFVERTKDVGLLVPSWAPQIKVLAHEATGGFLMHCGWNSVLESLAHGMPMVAWPLFAEQRQNAVVLAEGAGAAIRVPDTKRREEIAAAVREVMAGQGKGAEVRAKVAELQKAATEGLREGGAATTALDEVGRCRWHAGRENYSYFRFVCTLRNAD